MFQKQIRPSLPNVVSMHKQDVPSRNHPLLASRRTSLVFVRIIPRRTCTSRTAHSRRPSPMRTNRPSRRVHSAHPTSPGMRLIIRRPNTIPDGSHTACQRRTGTCCDGS